jgi:cell shape-determining protein MreD
MKNNLILLISVLVLAVLQGSFLSLNLILLLVLLRMALKPEAKNLWLAFLGGLILDLAKNQTLGLSAIVFLLAAGLIILYSKRFEPAWPPFLAILVLVTDLLWGRWTNGYFNWLPSLILSFLALLISFFWWRFVGRSLNEKIRLRNRLE